MFNVLAVGETTGINMEVADAIVTLTTKMLGLFEVFPLNVFLGAALCGIGISIYRSLKRS